MVTRLTNFALRGYQAYTIDKSLIKKVFSVRKQKEKKVMPGRPSGKHMSEVSTRKPTTLLGGN